MVHTYNGVLLNVKKDDFSLYMDEPWKHYAQWMNPGAKRHVFYASICMKYVG